MKLIDYIKFGFGFYIGYGIAKSLDEISVKVLELAKDRVKNGGC